MCRSGHSKGRGNKRFGCCSSSEAWAGHVVDRDIHGEPSASSATNGLVIKEPEGFPVAMAAEVAWFVGQLGRQPLDRPDLEWKRAHAHPAQTIAAQKAKPKPAPTSIPIRVSSVCSISRIRLSI